MKDQLNKLLENVWTLAIVCNQWGDTGKGKLVDLAAALWAQIVVRGTGGANAGHTISDGKIEMVVHQLPSGILHAGRGMVNIIGSGVAFDPRAALAELKMVQGKGFSCDNLFISMNAKLVLPQHKVMDTLFDSVGSTGRGIGPLYTDHVARCGLVVNDLLNEKIFRQKLKKNLAQKVALLKTLDLADVHEAMDKTDVLDFYDAREIFDFEEIVRIYLNYGERLAGLIRDTDKMVREAIGKKRILLEGAQGALLSINHGSYPYVTSSDCTVAGLATGSGLSEKDIDLTLGIVKFPFMTRVGGGPFPTELGGEKSTEYCRTAPRDFKTIETKRYGDLSINHTDPFHQGIAIRIAGGEYGATTGRPRRIGWLDLPLLRHAMITNGKDIVLTKPDVLDRCKVISICDYYIYEGPDYRLGKTLLKRGDELYVAPMDVEVLRHCVPHYQHMSGWRKSIKDCRSYAELPMAFRRVVERVRDLADAQVRIISVGADRDETIIIVAD